MTTSKKIIFTMGWLVASVAIIMLVQLLRQIGTTWMNEAGFLRVLFLGTLAASAWIPVILATLVWFDKPSALYKHRH